MGSLRLFTLSLVVMATSATPGPRESFRAPLDFTAGDDALLTCIVHDLGENTVLWKKRVPTDEEGDEIAFQLLTAGGQRVTSDKRVSVIHEPGGEVFVLVIKRVVPSDSGDYVCEVNSDPIVRSFHELRVTGKEGTGSGAGMSPEELAERHDYTDCCREANVTTDCLGFCRLSNIIDGTTDADPDACDAQFPAIVRCMADGRNHVPCCVEQAVPDICLEVCRGEYTVHTDDVRTHFSCSIYTPRILACIAEGVEVLPGPPLNMEVLSQSDSELKVTWSRPRVEGAGIDHFEVNLTRLATFDPTDDGPKRPLNDSQELVLPEAMQIQVPPDSNATVIGNLSAYTMYEVVVLSVNAFGRSLGTPRVRVLTLPADATPPPPPKEPPPLPDVRACCVNKGVNHDKCLNSFCNPLMEDDVSLPDLMICAPWAGDMFPCLTNGVDHTPCCRERGLPDPCLDLCSGQFSRIDFRYFKCISYMKTYTNCLLQGYGVLPSAPRRIRVTGVQSRLAAVEWASPDRLGETVTSYDLSVRRLGNGTYARKAHVSSPYVLEGLEPGVDHEVFVEAVNTHGIGEPSERVIFRTLDAVEETELSLPGFQFNETTCCVDARLPDECMPLCSYDVKMSVVRGLGPSCKEHFHTLLRCGSGGRDHAECCHRTGVHPNCAPLCQGIITPQVRDNPSFCLGFIGNIIQCFQEGTGLLPSPPLEFHLLGVTNNSVTLMWDRPVEGNVSGYQVRFQKVSAAFGGAPDLTMSQKMNVSEEKVVLGNLTNAEEYDFVVVAWNEHGFSLPSSSITVNVSETSYQGVAVAGVPPPPHSLTVADKSSTYLLISWLPPEISLISELLEYKLFHRTLNGTEFAETRTQKTWTKLDGLEPNTQYVIYARTLGEKGSSHPSETLIAWTDPFYPAFVEPPTIHPTSLVLEGSNITVVCIAMGEPTPAVSMYVAGRLVKNETTRHLVAVVANVSRNMGQISCLADNGFGSPAQAARNILISRKPLLEAADMTLASEGDSVTLECQVDAYPKPRLVWWRNDKPVIHGGKYDIQVRDSFENPGYYLMRLGISSVNASDNGEYRCFAENAFGNMSQVIQVSVRPRVEKVMNVSECCRKEGVSPECLDACWMNVDFESLADNPHCIPEYYKIMKCAADGSDHRGCCSQWGVPKRCLDWCRGEAVPNAPLCLISFLQQMLSCFHEGKDMLPGMPGNVHVEPVDDVTVNVIWDPPDKNAKMIDAYRVFWRPVGSASAEKTDTKETHLQIGGLEAGVSYEAAVKAGNNYGTSQLTQPVLFSTHAKSYSEPVSHRGGTVETVVGILVALVAIGAIAVGLLFYARKYRLFGHKATAEGVSFENPSYLREQTDPNTTVHQLGSGPESPGNGHVNGVNHNGHQGWHQEALHTSTPFHLDVLGGERLDVSHAYDAVGFQKLKNAPS